MKQPDIKMDTPELPRFVRMPFAVLPDTLKTVPLQRALNLLFAAHIQTGELDFLESRNVRVRVVDADLDFGLTLIAGKLCAGSPSENADLTIEGTVYTFLQLATRREDSDTLFFRRQLRMSGDTELGLYVKNFLEGVEPESLPLQPALGHILDYSLRAADLLDGFGGSRSA
jgi:predicted lipid carrier protein YhbT